MRRLLRHAYEKIAFYRKLFEEAGIKPTDIRALEDLAAIPVTVKRDLQAERPEDLTAAGLDPEKLVVRRTSGSTGEPFTIRRSWFEERLLQAFRRRALYLLGQRPRDRTVSIIRIKGVHPRDHQFPLRIANALGLYRNEPIDCFLPFSEMMDRLRKERFEILVGLTQVVYQLAVQINQTRSQGISPPRFVAVDGENLTSSMRREIETAFGAVVYDLYGCHEFNLLAWQCRETGEYHLCDDSAIVEILKDGRPAGPGEQGEVVATSLFSYSMPFIRYRLGDVAVAGSQGCACGSVFSTLREIRGRVLDYVVLGDGRHIHPYQIIRLLVHADKPWVRQYQLVQESVGRIVLKVAPFGTPEPETLENLEREIRAVTGGHTRFRIDLVGEIQREPSGKFKVFKSLVSPVEHSSFSTAS